jgi:hypothetical protein
MAGARFAQTPTSGARKQTLIAAMNLPTGVNFPKLKDNVITYWLQDPRMNWPVKVISAERGASMGAVMGGVVPIRGCVVSAKFVFGRPLMLTERILGLQPGELEKGALMLRLNRLPYTNEFDLAPGYTNVAAYPGYPPGLGSNQWILTADVLATVIKVAGPSQTL